MSKENIEKYSAGYALLKSFAGFWHNNIFYRKVIILGTDNIDLNEINIFAPNHQNALMDALAVLFTHKGQPVFLARSDIFKKKIIASILYFLKILPVYRLRDGFTSLRGNDEIFEKTIDVLQNKNGLVILPEGDHAGYRRLRQLKKGICRIAFQAEEASDFKLGIKIIPVGIDFTNYQRFRQVLTVVYGKPIDVSDYFTNYRENPDKAFNDLRSRLSDEMKKVMIHIDSPEDYEAIDELRSIVNGKFSDDLKHPRIYRDRELIGKINDLQKKDHALYEKICSLSLNVSKRTRDLKLNYRLLDKEKHPAGMLISGIIALIITFPLFIYGNIFNLTFLAIPDLQTSKIKDPQFHSSVKYGLSLGLAIVFLPVYLLVCLLVFSQWWVALLVFLSLPLSGLFAWNYYLVYKRLKERFRIRTLSRKKDCKYLELRKRYTDLMNLIQLINR